MLVVPAMQKTWVGGSQSEAGPGQTLEKKNPPPFREREGRSPKRQANCSCIPGAEKSQFRSQS
jgi:hypothetical protein